MCIRDRTDVDVENGERVAHEIGSSARFVKQDVRDEAGWIKLIQQTQDDFGGVNILVNNAGVVEVGTIESQSIEEYEFIMDVSSLRHLYHVCCLKTRACQQVLNCHDLAQHGLRVCRHFQSTIG